MNRLPKSIFGLDYTNEIPASVLRGAGARFVVRYLSRYSWKVLTPGEKARLDAAGIAICLVFEDEAFDAYRGYEQGKLNGELAQKQAMSLGFPANQCIYFADDKDSGGVSPGDTDQYYEGVAAVKSKRRCGPYGDFYVCERQADRGFGYAWQTYAWSRSQWSLRANIFQYSNGRSVDDHDVDFDEAWYADYGQSNYRPAVDEPYAMFPDQVFEFKQHNGQILKLNERKIVLLTDGALQHPEKYAKWLNTLSGYLKILRDRVWTVAHFTNPPAWVDDRQLGRRWQELNKRMARIRSPKPSVPVRKPQAPPTPQSVKKTHPELRPEIVSVVDQVLARFPDLVITSTSGGNHAANSYHYSGRACDLAGADMDAAGQWIHDHLEGTLLEGIHYPNLSVKNKGEVPGGFWGDASWRSHSNHIHLAA
jgi:Rv2525c-like, glycoside hydrolase-like domain